MADLKVLKVRGLGALKLREFEDKTLNLEISNCDALFLNGRSLPFAPMFFVGNWGRAIKPP